MLSLNSLTGSASLVFRGICLLAILDTARRYYNDLYIFGQRRAIKLHGVLSLRLKRSSICFADIREISLNQGLFGRIFGFGTLSLSTAATDQKELVFHDIPHIRALAMMIDKIAQTDRIERMAQKELGKLISHRKAKPKRLSLPQSDNIPPKI